MTGRARVREILGSQGFRPKGFQAFTLTIVNAGCLWGWFWLQYVTAFFFGLPFFSRYPEATLVQYTTLDGWSVNLPTLFWIISLVWAIALGLGVPVYLAGARAKVPQILMLLVFSMIVLGFSRWLVSCEQRCYEAVKYKLSMLRHHASDPHVEYEQREIQYVEELLETYQQSKQRP